MHGGTLVEVQQRESEREEEKGRKEKEEKRRLMPLGVKMNGRMRRRI